jgi:hypothetical protein
VATETITLRLVAQDLMSGNVSKAVGKIDTLAKRGGIVGSIFQGVGQRIGQMLNPLDLASRGFGVLTDVMMDGVKAAIEDEKAQEQLNQTIRANVKGWDENTAAIEDAIKAGAALAFTDDEIRAGLNQLIPRTKDIAEANRLNALAMDLARAKNLSLEESATLVGKAYSGQASALRRAGIAIKDTKNSTRALAELQSMVTGQADKYASTAEGSMAVLQITIDELVESLGYELLPHLKAFANYLRTDVIPRIDDATEALRLLGQAGQLSLSFIPRGNDGLSRFNDGLDGMSESIEKNAVVLTGTWGTAMKSAADDVVPLIASVEDVERVVMGLPRTFTMAVRDMKSAIAEGKKGIVEEFRDLAWQTKHPFADEKYANWLQRKYQKAGRLMKAAAKNGRPEIVDQYRALREDIMVEMALLPQNIAALQRRINSILGTIYSQVATAVTNVFSLGGDGGGIEVGGSNFMPSAGILSNTSPGSGMGSGGAPVINVTHIGSMSEADGQRFARTVAPHINRELGRAGR